MIATRRVWFCNAILLFEIFENRSLRSSPCSLSLSRARTCCIGDVSRDSACSSLFSGVCSGEGALPRDARTTTRRPRRKRCPCPRRERLNTTTTTSTSGTRAPSAASCSWCRCISTTSMHFARNASTNGSRGTRTLCPVLFVGRSPRWPKHSLRLSSFPQVTRWTGLPKKSRRLCPHLARRPDLA